MMNIPNANGTIFHGSRAVVCAASPWAHPLHSLSSKRSAEMVIQEATFSSYIIPVEALRILPDEEGASNASDSFSPVLRLKSVLRRPYLCTYGGILKAEVNLCGGARLREARSARFLLCHCALPVLLVLPVKAIQ